MEFRDIKGYEGKYQVGEDGTILSLGNRKNVKKTRIKKCFPTNSKADRGEPRMRVALNDKQQVKNFLVHRLVAEAFVDNPYGLPDVNHKDEDPMNNHWSNLEWCDQQYNNEYSKAKEWRIISPSGVETVVINLNKFCKDVGIHASNLHTHGRCKGWTLIGDFSNGY